MTVIALGIAENPFPLIGHKHLQKDVNQKKWVFGVLPIKQT